MTIDELYAIIFNHTVENRNSIFKDDKILGDSIKQYKLVSVDRVYEGEIERVEIDDTNKIVRLL